MRRTLMYSLIGLVGCTWLAGCQEKPEGAQTIIVELADPSDQQETEATNEGKVRMCQNWTQKQKKHPAVRK